MREIRQGILSLIEAKDRQCWAIDTAIIDPTPYDAYLTSLYICKSNCLLKVSVSTNNLEIEGNYHSLKILADWFDFDDNAKSNHHVHLDSFGNEFWVDSNSISAVFRVVNHPCDRV